MRYLLSFFAVLVLGYSPVLAQDTIVLKSGKKILAKHLQVREKVYFKYFGVRPPKYDSIEKSNVNYVVRRSGWVIPMVQPAWHNPIIITPGIGLSAMPYMFRSFLGDSGANIKSFSPVYNLNIDYSSNAEFSVGIGISWQSAVINPYVSYKDQSSSNVSFNPLYPGVNIYPSPNSFYPLYYTLGPPGGADNSISEKLTRFNVGFRMLYHIRNDEEEDFYFGSRVGISFWTDQSMPEGFTSLSGGLTKLSFQAIIGVRKELTDLIGINFEGGIGTPYQIEGGLYFKVFTKGE